MSNKVLDALFSTNAGVIWLAINLLYINLYNLSLIFLGALTVSILCLISSISWYSLSPISCFKTFNFSKRTTIQSVNSVNNIFF